MPEGPLETDGFREENHKYDSHFADFRQKMVAAQQSLVPLKEKLREAGKYFTIAETGFNTVAVASGVGAAILAGFAFFTGGATAPIAIWLGGIAIASGVAGAGTNITNHILDANRFVEDIEKPLLVPLTAINSLGEKLLEQRTDQITKISETSSLGRRILSCVSGGASPASSGLIFFAKNVGGALIKSWPRLRFGAAIAGAAAGAAIDAVFLGINIHSLITGDLSARANELDKFAENIDLATKWAKCDIGRRKIVTLIENYQTQRLEEFMLQY